jgi:hypothetical protein
MYLRRLTRCNFRKLKNVDLSLPGQLVFPDGPDLSQGPTKPKGSVLDEFN